MTLLQPSLLVPHHVTADGGRVISHLGSRMRFIETTETTGGQFWLADQVSGQGVASPLHRHGQEDETFFVLDGELEVTVGEQTTTVVGNGVQFAPRGLPHAFRVTSPSARFLILGTPAGFERWFFETADPEGAPPGPPDLDRLLSSLGRYGAELIGPPPGMGPGGPPPGTAPGGPVR